MISQKESVIIASKLVVVEVFIEIKVCAGLLASFQNQITSEAHWKALKVVLESYQMTLTLRKIEIADTLTIWASIGSCMHA